MRHIIILLFAALALSAQGLWAASITGSVNDSITAKPIAGVKVIAVSHEHAFYRETKTAPNGKFIFDSISLPENSVVVLKAISSNPDLLMVLNIDNSTKPVMAGEVYRALSTTLFTRADLAKRKVTSSADILSLFKGMKRESKEISRYDNFLVLIVDGKYKNVNIPAHYNFYERDTPYSYAYDGGISASTRDAMASGGYTVDQVRAENDYHSDAYIREKRDKNNYMFQYKSTRFAAYTSLKKIPVSQIESVAYIPPYVNFYDGKLAGNAPALVVRTTTGKDHPQSWKIPKYIAAVKL